MTTGALDAEGVWQYGEDDPVSPWSDYMNLLAESVSDVFEDRRLAVGSYVASSDTTTQTGAANSDFTYATASIVLPPGTWQITAHASLDNTVTTDTAAVSVWNDTTGAEVAGSIGPAANTGTAVMAGLSSRPVVVTLTATRTFKVRCRRNGGSTIRARSVAGAPAASIEAVRFK